MLAVSTAVLLAGAAAAHGPMAARAASAACSAVPGSPAIARHGHALCLDGVLDASAAARYFALAPAPGDVLVARGPGGEITSAMDIGDDLYAKNIPVVVDRPCVSSCAYFIALGARRLVFLEGGVLGFHGGPIPAQKILAAPQFDTKTKNKMIADNARFVRFFARRGIDIAVTNTPPPGFALKPGMMWTESDRALRGYGVRSIAYCAGVTCCPGAAAATPSAPKAYGCLPNVRKNGDRKR